MPDMGKKTGGTRWVTMLFWGICVLALGTLVYCANLDTEIPEEATPLSGTSQGFVYASGDSFYTSDGAPFQIRAMGFGNACWDNKNFPIYNYCTEESYRELAELGFNTVRFYLNYGLFERDSEPYVYSEEGFAWLDQNLEWAEKYGIRILFNMHYPQGGFQPLWYGLDLWRNKNEEQDRLTALWGAIAQRYADNPTVLGYGLVNEPYLLWKTNVQTTLDQWTNLAQRITDTIRSVDQNHIIFLEPATGAIEPYSGQTVYQLNDNYNLVTVKDPADNLAYELHFYQPMEFTHLFSGDYTEVWTYPDENRAVMAGNDLRWVAATYAGQLNRSAAKEDDSGWTYVETNWIDAGALGGNFMNLVMGCVNLDSGDKVYLDDLAVTSRQDQGGKETVVYEEGFASEGSWDTFVDATGGSSYAFVSDQGHGENGCLMIQGKTASASLQESERHYISLKEDCEYKVSAWVKVEGSGQSAQVFPQMSIYASSTSGSFTPEYMTRILESYQAAVARMGYPLFVGEFGLLPSTLDYGGDQWLADFLTVCNNKNISYSYHLYHGNEFGLYSNNSYLLPDNRNETIYGVLKDYIQ